MQTATNPQTGETIAYINGQWVPLPTGGLSFDRLRGTRPAVTPLDDPAIAGVAPEDAGFFDTMGRAIVNSAGQGNISGVGGALRMVGAEETGQGLVDFADRLGIAPAGVQSIEDIGGLDDAVSYGANMLGQGIGAVAGVALPALAGAAVGSAVAPGPGTVVGGLAGAAGASYIIQAGQLYNDLRARGLSHEDVSGIAALVGVPMAALDVIGLRGVMPALRGPVRDAVEDVLRTEATRSLVGTAARTAGEGAAKEGLTEAAQQGIQEGATAYADPNYNVADLPVNLADAFIGGALGGGVFGAAAAPGTRGAARARVTMLDQARAQAAEKAARDRETSGQLLLPPPSSETRRTPFRVAAATDLATAQDAVANAEARLAAYPGIANERRLEIVTRARDSALARLEAIDQTDVFAQQQEAPQVSAVTRTALVDQENERRRRAAIDAEAAARGVEPAAIAREQTAAEALRLRLESIDRAIRTVKKDLKTRPGFAPSVAKLNFLDQQRELAVKALGDNPASQLSGATRTIRAPSPDTDIQAFARETARRIVGDPNFWVPIKESDRAPVTGYINYKTGEIRSPEQHLAPIETPLSGREPVIPSPETMAQRAETEKAVAAGATAAQEADRADAAVEQRQRQDAVTAAQDTQREAIADQEKADADRQRVDGAVQTAGTPAVGATETVAPAPTEGAAPVPAAAPAVASAPVMGMPITEQSQAVAPAPNMSTPLTQAQAVVNETPIPEQVAPPVVASTVPRRTADVSVQKAKATSAAAKPKKGDLVAIERTTTYANLRGPATVNRRWEFGRVAKTDRTGRVTAVATSPGSDKPQIFEPGTKGRTTWSNIAIIPPERLAEGHTGESLHNALWDRSYDSQAEMVDALRERGAVRPKEEAEPDPPTTKAMRPDKETQAEPQLDRASHRERIQKTEADIRQMLKRMTGRDVDFSIIDAPMEIGGEKAVGGYNTQTKAIVVSAFDDAGHAYSNDFLTGFARHEAIHWIRDHGLFPDGAWSALEKASPRWMTRFKIKERYPGLTAEQQREEAIAEAYRAWGAGKLRLRGGPIQTAFEFIKQFLRSVARLFKTNGFQTAEDIFRDLDRGAFADAGVSSAKATGNRAMRPRAIDTAAFHRWFEGSKVVDENGDPLRVYHGTSANIGAFSPKLIGRNYGVDREGFFFTSNPDEAEIAADEASQRRGSGQNILPVYLSIKRPLIVRADYDATGHVDRYRDDLLKQAKRQKNDGIIVRGRDSQTFVAFRPEQIKSAIGNRGTFDPTNPDIRALIGVNSEWAMLRVGPVPAAPISMSYEDTMRAANARVLGLNRLLGDRPLTRMVGSALDRTRGALQDFMVPFRRFQEAAEIKTGQPIPEAMNVVLAEEGFAKKVGAYMLEADRRYREPIQDLINKHRIPEEDVGDYLLARHAQERNEQIAKINPKLPDGGSGITTAEANKRIRELEAKPYGKALKHIQRMMVDLSNYGLDALVETGQISADEAARMKAMYPNYVNLSGIEDPDVEHDSANVATGKGFMGTRGKEVKRATGRFTEPTDIRAQTYAQFDGRINRALKNEVRLALLNLAGAHPDPKIWTVEPLETRAQISKSTGQVQYVTRVDQGADVVTVRVDGQPIGIRFNTTRDEGKWMYETFSKLNHTEVNKVFGLMMRANQLLSRLNTTLNPEFMITAPIKDLQEAGINVQQYGVKHIASKAAAHLPGAMKAAWQYMNRKDVSGEWGRWVNGDPAKKRKGAAFGGLVTFFPQRMTADDYVKQFNRESKKTPLAMTLKKARQVGHFIEHANNAADMGTRLAVYRALVEGGIPEGKALSAARNLTVNFNRKGSAGPAMNALFMFFNASVQGTATMLAAIKNSKVVKGLVLGVVATGITQEIVMSMMSPPDPDDPSRTVYDAIPEYVKQRNLILWVNEDGSYVTFPKPWGYGAFHDVGRLMTRYLRGAPMGVGRPATVLDTIKDMGISFTNAFVPPGFDGLPMPTLFSPFFDIATNKDYAGKPIMPNRMPGDQRPNSQIYFPGESPITVEMADALNSITGGDAYRPGLVDISPEALTHVWSAYGGASLSFYTRAANTIFGAGAEALGLQRQDPDLDWNDIPFARKIVGQTGSWQMRDVTYQRIADAELMEDEIAGYQEQGDLARARDLRRENGPLVALAKEGRRLRRALGELRRERQGILDGPLPTEQARARIDAIDAREEQMMAAFNAKYVRALARTQMES